MTKHKDLPDKELERWLAGAAPPVETPIFAATLDAAFAAGPEPKTWRRAQQRLQDRLNDSAPRVYYDRVGSSLVGPLWVAVTDHGLAAVTYGGSEAEFAGRVGRRLRSTPVRSTERTVAVRRELDEYLRGRRTSFSVPVDLRHVTPFQRSVLEAARSVPRGQVASYGDIGRRIGKPGAARAVGQALGSNPVPIVVPCHRVLASDGSLGGYSGRGGLRTKRRLLALEGAALP
ncbi:MAG TPA: methylated-DNA--[protein]-cysteine S-methyltransferase [Anaerolineales bacterium]|nr:methylated-DNA--[protein]-cysteine S-methyltransferase [Anaerolineales bacterium]